MSFLKFQGYSQNSDRGKVHYGRAGIDQAPFRGDVMPMLRDEEFDELTERVYDTHSGVFDTSCPEQTHHGRTYQQVLDAIVAGWFVALCPRKYKWIEVDGEPRMYVYVEWAEPYNELPASRAAAFQGATKTTRNEVRYDRPDQDFAPRGLLPQTGN